MLLAAVTVAAAQPVVHPQGSTVAATGINARFPSSSPTATQPAASQSAQARRIETIEYDFGKAWAGDTVTHTFELTNPSDRVLGIRGVTTSCGCTTTGNWQRQVEPARVWTLDVTLATAHRRGTLRKTVTVNTDDPDRPQAFFVLKGEIQPRFEFSPAENVTFGALKPGETTRRTVTIVNKYTEPVIFTRATPTGKSVKATLREVEKGQRYELVVETIPPLPEAGSLGTITLETNLQEQPAVTVPVYGTVRPRVYLAPKTVAVPVPTIRDIHRAVQLVTTEGEKARLLDVETSNPAITAVIESGPGDQSERIRVTVPQGIDLQPAQETLTVYTSDPEFPKLTCQFQPFNLGKPTASRPAGTQPTDRRLERMPVER